MPDFEHHVRLTIARRRLLDSAVRIGVALSGGADSVATLMTLKALGYDCVALHCNFSLRGDESDGDTEFCREIAGKVKCPFYEIRFDTRAEKRPRESIEMACRRLRYDWFDKMAGRLNLDAVALGHHREDSAETIMMNLLRGTGLKGLQGIPPRRGIYVRPLIDRSREEIEEYLSQKGLGFRTDSSNLSNEYRRNVLRNKILPEISADFPDAEKGILSTAAHVSEAAGLLDCYLSADLDRYMTDKGLDVAAIAEESPMASEKLYYLAAKLFDGGISIDTAASIIRSARDSGRIFATVSGITLELNRGHLSELPPEDPAEHPVDLSADITSPVDIKISVIDRQQFESADKNRLTAFFDSSVLDGNPCFIIRHPAKGDRMAPFGMKGTRLLSDIFNDLKMSLGQKRRQWVLCRDKEIIWIPGIRASRRFQVTGSTQKVIALSFNHFDSETVIS